MKILFLLLMIARVSLGDAENQVDGFELSDRAKKQLGILSIAITPGEKHAVPTGSLVFFRDEVGVYRFRNGRYKFLEVKIINRSAEQAIILSKDFEPGDHIVSNGVPLLRVADLEVSAGETEGHGH